MTPATSSLKMPVRACRAIIALASVALAQDFRALDPAADPPGDRMLSGYLQRLAARQLAERRRQVAAIRTRQDYEGRKARVRAAVLRMIGGLDEERTPLNPRVTGTLDRGAYRVEKVIYESRPRLFVTANLYVPKGEGPFAAVLQPVGHSVAAKNRAFYQGIALSLVAQRLVVLVYDPVGQGGAADLLG